MTGTMFRSGRGGFRPGDRGLAAADKNYQAHAARAGRRVAARLRRHRSPECRHGRRRGRCARQELAAALDVPTCKSEPDVARTSAAMCWLPATNGWAGSPCATINWISRPADFAAAPDSGWSAWVQGRREFAAGRYGAAATQYGDAVSRWKPDLAGPASPLCCNPSDRGRSLPTALADWGGARLLAGDLPGAIVTLDASLQVDSSNAHALFLRARAKELAGRNDAALADYNLASRTAFAAARDLASGEAHLYRGIALYRRKDFAHAEEEFASALNFEITGALRPDARAWRHLAAVAGGSCGTSRQSLDVALGSVSPFFPQDEARSLASACGSA